MIGRLAAQMLDPYFVREEELAAIMERSSTKNYSRRFRRIGALPTGNLMIRVPNQHQWLLCSVICTEITDAGVGAIPKIHMIDISDEQDNMIFVIGTANLPAVNALSYVTWGLDLNDSIYDNGQLPPSYYITNSLPRIWLHENYRIRFWRDGIGGIPVVNGDYSIIYEEVF